MRPTDKPAAAKKMGNSSQASPSLRLLTSPACEHDDRARSPNELSRNTAAVDNPWWCPSVAGTWWAAS